MNKKYFVLTFVMICSTGIVQTSFGMEGEREKKDATMHENGTFYTDNDDDTTPIEKPMTSFDKISLRMHVLNNNFEEIFKRQDQEKTTLGIIQASALRGVSNGIATVVSHYFVKTIDKGVGYLFPSKEDLLVQEHTKNAEKANLLFEKMQLHAGLLQLKKQQLDATNDPRKKAILQEEYLRFKKAEKILKKELKNWEEAYLNSILQHKKHKAKQSKTIFNNQNGELTKVQEQNNNFDSELTIHEQE